MALSERLDIETGSDQFNMAAALLNVSVPHLIYMTAEKFEGFSIYFRL
jgi:hypothetical protein